MVKYDLDHLVQAEDQNVGGPIQDDEALFLYSIIRGCRLSRVLEIGGLDGYSAKNFLKAMDFYKKKPHVPEPVKPRYMLYTCDLFDVPKHGPNHKVIVKNAVDLTTDDVDNEPLDLVFFDCHDMVQMLIFTVLRAKGLITDKTIIALHDTNLHYAPFHHRKHYPPYDPIGDYVKEDDGWAHQPVERKMTNLFKEMGYDVFSIGTDVSKHSDDFPVRHGMTICKKFTPFN